MLTTYILLQQMYHYYLLIMMGMDSMIEDRRGKSFGDILIQILTLVNYRLPIHLKILPELL
jgi:hypothetical protein